MTPIVDATVVADAILKTGARAKVAQAALATSDVPHYALKEVRHGPFGNFVYAHNLLAETGSMRAARLRVAALGRSPYRQRTAQEALDEAEAEFNGHDAAVIAAVLAGASRALGVGVTGDVVFAVQYRLALGGIVRRAHAQIAILDARATNRLSCFQSKPLTSKAGNVVEDGVRKCAGSCALGAMFASLSVDVATLQGVVAAQPQKRENTNRGLALQFVLQYPGVAPSVKHCRALGDAVYALLCPPGGTIVTTNLADHAPLAAALGKTAKTP